SEYEERFILGSLPMFCTYKAAMRLWPDAPGKHGVMQLLYWLEDGGRLGPAFDRQRAYPPHRAGPDSYATAWLLKSMLDDGRPRSTPAGPSATSVPLSRRLRTLRKIRRSARRSCARFV